MRIAGAIIAGGAATRLGGEKPFAPFCGGTLLEAVIARVRPQVDLLALSLRAGAADTARAHHALPVLIDTVPGSAGPLAGIVAALEWARSLEGVAWLASFPGDTPFLPDDLVAALRAAVSGGVPVVAHDGAHAQHLCALWPLTCLEALRGGMESGRLRSLYRAQEELGAVSCTVTAPMHAFFNVNTAEELAEAEALAVRERG